MYKYKGINVNKLLQVNIKLFILTNLFFPYVTKLSYRNTIFILGNVFGIVIILGLMYKKKKCKNNNYFLWGIVLIYNIIMLIYNILYHNYFIEQINKSISFILFILLTNRIDAKFIKSYNILDFLIKCIVGSVSLSIIYYLLGGDAIAIENLGILFRRQGEFEANRLTWLYGHKSTYALILLLYISLILKYKDLFKKERNFILSLGLCIIATILTDSATALILIVIILICNYISKFNIKKNTLLKVIIIPFAIGIGIILLKIAFNEINETRNLSTLGSRTYIFEAAIENLSIYPKGVGKEFGNIVMNATVVNVENFHNVFLNEMFRFSIIVGIVYIIWFIAISAFTIRKSGIFAVGVWGACFTMMNVDYALKTEQLSIFLFLIYFILVFRLEVDY